MTAIRFTSAVGRRTVGEIADLAPESAAWLTDRECAEDVDTIPDAEDDTAPRPPPKPALEEPGPS